MADEDAKFNAEVRPEDAGVGHRPGAADVVVVDAQGARVEDEALSPHAAALLGDERMCQVVLVVHQEQGAVDADDDGFVEDRDVAHAPEGSMKKGVWATYAGAPVVKAQDDQHLVSPRSFKKAVEYSVTYQAIVCTWVV